MKAYTNLEDINRDLKILQLERKIALEKIKKAKGDTVARLHPVEWFPTYFYKKIMEYGVKYLFKKNK